jgi:hypothetical protein
VLLDLVQQELVTRDVAVREVELNLHRAASSDGTRSGQQ